MHVLAQEREETKAGQRHKPCEYTKFWALSTEGRYLLQNGRATI